MAKDHYGTLGLPPNATAGQIRARFLELARTCHPDRFQGADKERAEGEFQAITEAFNILSDPERRRRHDLERSQPYAAGRQPSAADPGRLAQAYVQRGVRSYKEQHYREAAHFFTRATREDAGNARAWHHLALALSHDRRSLGRATSAIARACELEPMKASYHKLAGRLFEAADRPEEAEMYYTEALKWSGGDAAVEKRLASLRRALRGGRGLFGKGS